ncbi:MAG: 2-dehydro-3-deoxy-6-phosphogalactonate aldolase [Rhizobiaceae bacterium]|nr:2-dehydro-3-deoxy-6-phosphogalactonate aldolase [Rhizobiaceae bacterium]
MRIEEIWNSLDCKLIAILRGISPKEIEDAVKALLEAGFEAIEIPLNSPDAIQSIKLAVGVASEHSTRPRLIGAGTVLTEDEVREVASTGANLIVSPNAGSGVIELTKELGMFSAPGVFTPSECISAIHAGADCLKVFPASNLGLAGFKAYRAVLPSHVPLCAVGGVGDEDFSAYMKAGAEAFGLGSSLYSVGMSAKEIGERASRMVDAYRQAMVQ